MKRTAWFIAVAAVAVFAAGPFQHRVAAQGDGGYKLVANWPHLPQGMYFGLKDAPPPPAEREAQAAARRARGGGPGGSGAAAGSGGAMGGPTNQPGISGLAIDQHDRIFVFNRGVKPVMVFDTDGNLILSGAEVATQRRSSRSCFIRSPSKLMNSTAVEPVPSPNTMPGLTSSSAFAAACLL